MILIIKGALSYQAIATQGWLYGLIMIVGVSMLFERLIVLMFNVEPLNQVDKNVFYDQESNRCNIMASLLFEKCSHKVLEDVFLHKMVAARSRFRSRMVKILDNYYFQELPKDELQR